MSVLVSHNRFRELVDTYFATVDSRETSNGVTVLYADIDGLPLCAIAPNVQHQDAA